MCKPIGDDIECGCIRQIREALPPTAGKWTEYRARDDRLSGWIELFSDGRGHWYSVPETSRSVRVA